MAADNFDTLLKGLAEKERQVSSGSGVPPKLPGVPGSITSGAGDTISIPPPPSGPPRVAPGQGAGQSPERQAAMQRANEGIGTAVAGLAPMVAGAGAMALAPRIPYVATLVNYLPLPLQRIILGAVGGGAGGAVEGTLSGEGPVAGAQRGAAIGGTMSAVGEAVGAGGRAVLQRTPITRGMPAKAMARDFGKLAGEVSPSLAARSAQELDVVGTYPTQARRGMSAYQETQTAQAQSLLGPQVTVSDPTSTSLQALSQRVGFNLNPNNPAHAAIIQQAGTGQRMTLSQLDDRLEELGAIGWPSKVEGSPMMMSGSSAASKQARDNYRVLHDHVEREMKSYPGGAEAFDAWERGRYARSVGIPLLEIVESEAWKRRAANGMSLDTKAFQAEVRKHLDELRERMRPEDYRSLVQIVWRGADPSRSDVTRKGLMAKAQGYLGLQPGTKYTGVEPFTLPQWAQIALDATMIGAVDRAIAGAGGGSGAPTAPARGAELPPPRSLAGARSRPPATISPEVAAAHADVIAKAREASRRFEEQRQAEEAARKSPR